MLRSRFNLMYPPEGVLSNKAYFDVNQCVIMHVLNLRADFAM